MTDYSLFKHVFDAAMQGKVIEVDFGSEWRVVTLSEAVSWMPSKKPEQIRAKLEFIKIGEQTVTAPVKEETDFFIDVNTFGMGVSPSTFRVYFADGEALHYASRATRVMFGENVLIG